MSGFTVIYVFQHATSGLYVKAEYENIKTAFTKLLDKGTITMNDEFTFHHPEHGKMKHTVNDWLTELNN